MTHAELLTSINPTRQQILTMQRRAKKGAAVNIGASVAWPLVLYSLIQIAANLLLALDNQHNLTAAAHFYKQHNNNNGKGDIFKSQNQASTTSNQLQYGCGGENLCSSRNEISTQLPSTASSKPLLSYSSQTAYHYLSSLLQVFNQQYNNGRTIFGGRLLMASATSLYPELQQISELQDNKAGSIINLNSTNFNPELIQYKHPFPHMKLVEYYLAYCGFCVKFKADYLKLAKDIHRWKNVIRPSAIDLAVQSNSPISQSWNIKEVPTLRIHPPPNLILAAKLHKQLTSFSQTTLPSDLHKAMFQEFNSSNLMIHSISLSDLYNKDKKCPLCSIKSELLLYIERYVRQLPPSELPSTWPNLRPVTEINLLELRQNHPRQELFLIIEGPTTQTSDSDQSSLVGPSLGLNLILELSSSAAWKALRYVRASENKQLLEDVIAQQKRAAEQTNENSNEQLELLQNFLSNKQSESNSLVLIHIDGSHSPVTTFSSSAAFPVMKVVTSAELVTMEKTISSDIRFKRFASSNQNTGNSNFRQTRSLSSSELTPSERLLELFAQYIRHTYTETEEDREFEAAINNPDEGFKSQETQPASKTLDASEKLKQINNYSQQPDQVSLKDKIYNIINPHKTDKKKNSVTSSIDHGELLKGMRYMLFNEIPRFSLTDKSLAEQQEKLNTLVNLVTVIKSYFPFADSQSTQFIDGVQSYLLRQQSRLLSMKTHDLGTIIGFDTRAFKQELKRLESEGKRLPEIKEWKHCTSYPCALWRLFHTLTAFEYKKLSQLRQPSTFLTSTGLQTAGVVLSNNNNLSPSVAEAITMKSTSENGPPSPVERSVSPPSTTTSRSLTIVTPNASQISNENVGANSVGSNNNNIYNKPPLTEADLPMPVLLVMRDYITSFFSCVECAIEFRKETASLSLERIRQEPAEFSILWLWETHNRVNKRLSVDPSTNPVERPKKWFPSFNQCASCYNKPPSFLQDPNATAETIFQDSIDWNRGEVLSFLLCEYSKPLDSLSNIFGNHIVFGPRFIIVICIFCLVLIIVTRCATCYVERQRRHKATLLNGNGAHYSLELQ